MAKYVLEACERHLFYDCFAVFGWTWNHQITSGEDAPEMWGHLGLWGDESGWNIIAHTDVELLLAVTYQFIQWDSQQKGEKWNIYNCKFCVIKSITDMRETLRGYWSE